MSDLGGGGIVFVTVTYSVLVYNLACPPSCPKIPLLCLIYRRHSRNAALIEFDLFEFYIYPIIRFDVPFANLA